MNVELVFAVVESVALIIYLFLALLLPEKFS